MTAARASTREGVGRPVPWRELCLLSSAACCSTWGISPGSVRLFVSKNAFHCHRRSEAII